MNTIIVFFYGDLNYRLRGECSNVKKWIEEGLIEKLQEADQLKREHRKGRVFAGWNEIQPTFRPTYRYERDVLDENGKRIYSEEKTPGAILVRQNTLDIPSQFFEYHAHEL